MMFVPIGAGISHLVALGAEHAVRRAILDNEDPVVILVYSDCVCTQVRAACRWGTNLCPFVSGLVSVQL